jgi:hypothetical protein
MSTPDQASTQTANQRVNAGTAVLAGGAVAGLGVSGVAVAPVVIGVKSAAQVVSGVAAAAAATVSAVSAMTGQAIQKFLQRDYPLDTPPLTEIEQRAQAFREDSATRTKEGLAKAVALPSKAGLIKQLDAQIKAEVAKPVPDARRLAALARARQKTTSEGGPREAAVRAVVERERRYAAAHARAQVARARGMAERNRLERVSPEGGFWVLGEAKTHTLDCELLSNRFWPHEVLRTVFPPVHVGCACSVLAKDKAISLGLMTADDVPSVGDAVALAKKAMALSVHEAEGILAVAELESRGIDPATIQPLSGVYEDEWDAGAPFRLQRAVERLGEGETLRLGDGTSIRRVGDALRVRRDGRVVRDLSVEEAVADALNRSVRSRKPNSIGGAESFQVYEDFLGARN